MQLHDHCFIAFWTKPWDLKLRCMKSLQKGHGCVSNILLKNRIITNKVFYRFFMFDCEVS